MKKILILEDDDNRILIFKRNYSFCGYELVFVKHSNEAIEQLKNNKFDFIFLDHDLNGKQMNFDPEDCGPD